MDDLNFTSDDIAAAVKDAAPAPASSAAQPHATDPTPGTAPIPAAGSPETPPAAAPPAAGGAPATADPKRGPIPLDRHESILAETRSEFEARIQRLAWAEGLTPDAVQQSMALAEMVRRRDPRVLEFLQPAAATPTNTEPQPDARDEQNVPYYTPAQAAKWAEWKAAKMFADYKAEIDARLGPIESERQAAALDEQVVGQVQDASQWPGFRTTDAGHAENIRAVADLITENTTQRQRDPRVAKLTMHEAYIRAGIPQKLAAVGEGALAAAKKTWLAELNKNTAAAQTELNPASASPSGSKKKDADMSFSELINDEVSQRAARAS